MFIIIVWFATLTKWPLTKYTPSAIVAAEALPETGPVVPVASVGSVISVSETPVVKEVSLIANVVDPWVTITSALRFSLITNL